MQPPGTKDIVYCVQLGRFARPPPSAEATLHDLAKRFICPTCYVRRPGEAYPVSLSLV
jgi:hypothetical protein